MHLEWAVPYAPGELKAVATKEGKVVKTDVVRTAGAPATLRLSADRTRIAADGQDLSFVKVEVLDRDGNLCPNADNEIHFDVNGNALAIAGLDNGDATNHESFQGRDHQAYHGLALAVLKSDYKVTGDAKLTASGAGLTPASITLSNHHGEMTWEARAPRRAVPTRFSGSLRGAVRGEQAARPAAGAACSAAERIATNLRNGVPRCESPRESSIQRRKMSTGTEPGHHLSRITASRSPRATWIFSPAAASWT